MTSQPKVLVIEHGFEGSAREIVDELESVHPDWKLKVVNFREAWDPLHSRDWSAIVIDLPGIEAKERVLDITQLECLKSWDFGIPTILAVDDKSLIAGTNGRSDSKSKEIFYGPWQLSTRRPSRVLAWLEAMTHPHYQEVQKKRIKEA